MDGAYIALNRYNHLKTIETRSEKRMNRFKMIFEVIEVLYHHWSSVANFWMNIFKDEVVI